MKHLNRADKDRILYAAFFMCKLEGFTEEHEKYGNTELAKVARAAANMVKGYLNKLKSMANDDELAILRNKVNTQTMVMVYNDQVDCLNKNFHKAFEIEKEDLEVLVGHAVHGSCTNCHKTGIEAKLCDLRIAMNHIEIEGHSDTECPYMGMKAEE